MKTNRNHSQPPPRKHKLARIKRTLRQHLPALREQYAVKSLGICGSYVRGENRKRSDLDILVEIEQVQWNKRGRQRNLHQNCFANPLTQREAVL